MGARSGVERTKDLALLAAGCLGAGVMGALFDQLTVTISPEYFLLGKGLAPDGLHAQAAWLGFRSALPIGAWVVGGALVHRRSDTWCGWRRWCWAVAGCTGLAIVCAELAMVGLDPFGVRVESVGILSGAAAHRFLAAWGLHVGAYVGTLLGVCVAWVVRPKGLRDNFDP